MHYAALDAHVLVQIYEKMMVEAANLNYDIADNIEVLKLTQDEVDPDATDQATEK